MKLPLDTHLLSWAAGLPDPLSAIARPLPEGSSNELLFSAANFWEIAIKRSLGRSDFQVDAKVLRRGLLDNGYQELAITAEYVVSIDSPVGGATHPLPGSNRSGQIILTCHIHQVKIIALAQN